MAAIPLTVDGVLYDLQNKTTQRVVLIGEASLTNLGVGGGPIIPPDQPPIDLPPHTPGHPAFPIWGPPGINFPDKPGYPPVVGGGPIIPPDSERVPGWEAKAVWTADTGWAVVIVPKPETEVPTPSKVPPANAPPPKK